MRLENLDTDLRPPPAAIRCTHEAIDDDAANSYPSYLPMSPSSAWLTFSSGFAWRKLTALVEDMFRRKLVT
ncbi:hypothetical protein [Cupriavidus necator]